MSLTIPYQFAPLPITILFDNELSGTFKEIFSYVLYRKNIAGWVIRKTDICNKLNLSMSTVKRGLKKLRELGYAHYDASGWTIYPDRQAPKDDPIGSIMTPPKGSIVTPLYKEDSLEKKKQQHAPLPVPEPIITSAPAPTAIIEQEPVVVSFEDNESLKYPEQLSKDQKKYIKAKIKTAPVDLQQDVLFELAYRMTLQTIHNVAGYVNNMIIAANNGTFTRTGGSGSVKKVNPAIAKTQALFDYQASFKRSDEETYRAKMAILKAATR
jgi:hypothetical protein